MTKPLEHIRVLDLSRVLAGPMASQTLADLGAEVIKIERPGAGDDTRNWGPPFLTGEDNESQREAAYFLSTNRGKKSVTIDFTQPRGQALVQEIARHCDIVLENFKFGGLAKYALDYASLCAVNEQLIYCSITGFGQTGPYRERVGYDFMIQGMSGLMSITGEPDERPGGAPMKVGVAVSDIFTGLYSTVGILAALQHRDRTGEGQHIDMALLDSQVAVLANQAMNYLTTGNAPGRLGNAHPNIVPYQVFATQDGHLILAVGNERQFEAFCGLAGRPELVDDSKFSTNAARVAHRDEVTEVLQRVMCQRTTERWIKDLEGVGVPCGPINDIEQIFNDPQVRERGLRLELEHATLGKIPSVACPIRYSKTPLTYETPPPVLGQHVEQVLSELLGLTPDEIQRYRDDGVV